MECHHLLSSPSYREGDFISLLLISFLYHGVSFTIWTSRVEKLLYWNLMMDLNGKDSNVEGSVLGVWNVNCKNKMELK
jgi:hypothetical protein